MSLASKWGLNWGSHAGVIGTWLHESLLDDFQSILGKYPGGQPVLLHCAREARQLDGECTIKEQAVLFLGRGGTLGGHLFVLRWWPSYSSLEALEWCGYGSAQPTLSVCTNVCVHGVEMYDRSGQRQNISKLWIWKKFTDKNSSNKNREFSIQTLLNRCPNHCSSYLQKNINKREKQILTVKNEKLR